MRTIKATKDNLQTIYLDFVNDWLTVSACASHYQMDENTMKRVLKAGRAIHNKRVAEFKGMPKYFNTRAELNFALSALTNRFYYVDFTTINQGEFGEFMGACYYRQSLSQYATFTVFQSYDEKYNKVWRLNYCDL